MKIETKNLEIDVVSDLYSAGFTIDGDEYVAERYFIVAQDSAGNRWSLGCFCGAEKVLQEGEAFFKDIREEARASADRLLARINDKGVIDTQFWREDRPVYGSKAYVQYGQAEDVAYEKKFNA